MTAPRIFRRARAPFAGRLVGWALVAAVCCFLLWIVFGGASQAQSPPGSLSGAGDPRSAARAIGNAGAATAGAIARDASKTANVPGYAGTNIPERSIGADALESEGRARLADPDDPGGAAGRSVVEGATTRPNVPVTGSDPGVARGKAVTADPQNAAHGADSLASGGVSDCGAGLPDADRGGACGAVRWCVGADCGSTEPEANAGFVEATTRLNMAVEMGGEEFDRDSLRIFAGRKRACHIHFGGLANCCKNSGLLVGLANCSASERELAEERNAGNTHYLGRYCSKRAFFGACIRRSRAWCVFSSKLGRILHQQARPQLGMGWGSCRGFTVAEIERIDFGALDLSEFAENMMDGAQEPAVTLPDAGDTQTLMKDRVRAFYGRSP
ncbi:MAG: conjugal transfer protein TraN [Rhodospirillaceae bacterium]|nr:conjugal transfer protein TraN [Rhodospirillaceae bacterium]